MEDEPPAQAQPGEYDDFFKETYAPQPHGALEAEPMPERSSIEGRKVSAEYDDFFADDGPDDVEGEVETDPFLAMLQKSDKCSPNIFAFENSSSQAASHSPSDVAFREVVVELAKRVDVLSKSSGQYKCGFDREFLDLRERTELADGYGAQICKQAPSTMAKNRYRNVLPLEATRVRLPIGEDATQDYINANHIGMPSNSHNQTYSPGHLLDRCYISTQAPPNAAIPDFWLMVWTLEVRVILMLTRTQEGRRVKADKYWPCSCGAAEAQRFGRFTVTLELEQPYDGFVVRRLLIQRGGGGAGSGDVRRVTQIQHVSWPDHGALNDFKTMAPMLSLLHQHGVNSGEFFEQEAEGTTAVAAAGVEGAVSAGGGAASVGGGAISPTSGATAQISSVTLADTPDVNAGTHSASTPANQGPAAPIVVHCSAGIGRSGTLIAIDIMLRRILHARMESKTVSTAAEVEMAKAQMFDAVDVCKLVTWLKYQRPGMVNSKEQYQMIYRYVLCVLENS
jgi:protein tyrosine phosphatase